MEAMKAMPLLTHLKWCAVGKISSHMMSSATSQPVWTHLVGDRLFHRTGDVLTRVR